MAKKAFEYIWCERKRTIFGLPWTFTKYFLTKSKFITREGLFSLAEDEFDLYKVTDKKLVLPFWQRLFGCGTIVIYVRDTDTPTKEIKFIKHPREVLALFDEQIDAERDRYSTRGRDLYGGAHHAHHCQHDVDGDGVDDYSDAE